MVCQFICPTTCNWLNRSQGLLDHHMEVAQHNPHMHTRTCTCTHTCTHMHTHTHTHAHTCTHMHTQMHTRMCMYTHARTRTHTHTHAHVHTHTNMSVLQFTLFHFADRSIRPFFPIGFSFDTQVIINCQTGLTMQQQLCHNGNCNVYGNYSFHQVF